MLTPDHYAMRDLLWDACQRCGVPFPALVTYGKNLFPDASLAEVLELLFDDFDSLVQAVKRERTLENHD